MLHRRFFLQALRGMPPCRLEASGSVNIGYHQPLVDQYCQALLCLAWESWSETARRAEIQMPKAWDDLNDYDKKVYKGWGITSEEDSLWAKPSSF